MAYSADQQYYTPRPGFEQSGWSAYSPTGGAYQKDPLYEQIVAMNKAQSGAQGGGQTAPTGPSGAPPGSPFSVGTVNGQGGIPLPSLPGAPNVNLNQQGVNAPSTQWDALQRVLANPGDVASNPAYQFLQQQGQQALDRTLGANQQRFSGGALTEAQKFGQGLAGQYFGQLTNTLGNAAQLELSRFLQPAQAQAGLNVNVGQLANQNWGNLANAAVGTYQAGSSAANAANQGMYQAGLLNQAQQAQQGYQNLIPTVQNIAAQLQGSSPAYSPTNIPTSPYGGATSTPTGQTPIYGQIGAWGEGANYNPALAGQFTTGVVGYR